MKKIFFKKISWEKIPWKKILKVVSIIALIIIAILIIYHLILGIIYLVEVAVSYAISGLEWLAGIVVFYYLAKHIVFGSGGSSHSMKRKKPYFMSDARDGVPDARHQVHDARDGVPDARDNVAHSVKNERDRRRW
ncbi:hypothetical protein ACLJJ6_02205 [Pediococcus siamensis]|uniref:hypothetical protein n=1 Tax=Pediococcus siamensis TaxID=381829 RepID=UPI0039A02599